MQGSSLLAGNAVDGNLVNRTYPGEKGEKLFISYQEDPNNFWMVDLGDEYDISKSYITIAEKSAKTLCLHQDHHDQLHQQFH